VDREFEIPPQLVPGGPFDRTTITAHKPFSNLPGFYRMLKSKDDHLDVTDQRVQPNEPANVVDRC
jgi:hypothetical protein